MQAAWRGRFSEDKTKHEKKKESQLFVLPSIETFAIAMIPASSNFVFLIFCTNFCPRFHSCQPGISRCRQLIELSVQPVRAWYKFEGRKPLDEKILFQISQSSTRPFVLFLRFTPCLGCTKYDCGSNSQILISLERNFPQLYKYFPLKFW